MQFEAKKETLPLLTCVVAWILGAYFYSKFPEQVITHWNFKGVADGYSTKVIGAFLMPVIMTIIYGLFLVLPFLDPKKENYKKFAPTYYLLRTVFLAFFLILSAIVGAVNLGVNLPINTFIPSLIGLLFIFIGSITSKIEQNWFVGFRLPWTLSSEYVWKKTNRFGGWSLIFFGGLMLIMPLLPEAAGFVIFISGLLLVVFGTSIYSYLTFRKEQNVKAGTKIQG